jgi:hypothetical protein
VLRRQAGVSCLCEGAAHPGLYRPRRIDEALLERTSHHAPVEELLPEVLVPQVVVSVELDEPDRTVGRGNGSQLGQEHGVVAAQAERCDACRDELGQRGCGPVERIGRRAGHRRSVSQSTSDNRPVTPTSSNGL